MAKGIKTGGRKKGSVNKANTLGRIAAKLIAEKTVNNIKITPLEYLMNVVTNNNLLENGLPEVPMTIKIDAAKAAAPYIHKKMPQETQISAPKGGSATLIITGG